MKGLPVADSAGSASSELDAGAPGIAPRRPPSDGQRRALLQRTVADLTREWRASVRESGDFEVLLVRGRPVRHYRHLVLTAALAVLAVIAGQAMEGGFAVRAATAAVPAAYALFWLFLAATGGEAFERISVDEQGQLHSVKWGRSVDTRGDFGRIALPVAVIAVAGWLAVGQMTNIAFPSPPRCNVDESYWPNSCFTLPRLGGGGGVATDAPLVTDAGVVTTQPVIAGALSVAETQQLERFVHAFLLVIVLCLLLPAIWFLFRMLTGRSALFVRPISRSRRE